MIDMMSEDETPARIRITPRKIQWKGKQLRLFATIPSTAADIIVFLLPILKIKKLKTRKARVDPIRTEAERREIIVLFVGSKGLYE